MNWDLVQGNLKQFKGRVRVSWCTLIGDHLGVISAKRTQSVGERQAAYGVLRAKALRDAKSDHPPARSFFS